MTAHDFWVISPALAMAAVAMAVVLTDLLMPEKEARGGGRVYLPGLVALAGICAPLVLTLNLWAGWWGDNGAASAFSGALVADRFALFFQFMLTGITAAVILASHAYARERLAHVKGEFIALTLFSVTGMMLLVSARELISIYVSLELTALPVAAIAAFSKGVRGPEAGLKFLILSGLSSAVLLYGLVFLYGYTGSTDLAVIFQRINELAVNSREPFGSYAVMFALMMVVAGFGFKMAVVPWQMWVPDVYEGSPTPLAAFLSVASKAAAFAVVLRILYTAFGTNAMAQDWSGMFAVLAAATMTAGNLLALSQRNIKRLLGYSTIAHAGYMLVGVAAVAANSRGGVAVSGTQGVLFYLAGYAFTNLAVFFSVIAVTNRTGNETISGLNGLAKRSPLVALLLTFGILSLLGIPPTVGFMSKVFVFSAAVSSGLIWVAVIGVMNSVVSAYYYLNIVRAMYFEEPDSAEKIPLDVPAALASAAGAAGIAVFGLGPWVLLHFAEKALPI